MTKQEEIREGIKKIFLGYDLASNEHNEQAREICATNVLGFLHSKGVVIKVDRELPQVPSFFAHDVSLTFGVFEAYAEGQKDMLKAGYVAVEPLIKEGEVKNNSDSGISNISWSEG